MSTEQALTLRAGMDTRRLPAPFEDYLATSTGDILSDKCKVTPADVAAMRDLVASGMTQREVARRFSVSQGSVSLYLSGRTKTPPGEPIVMRSSMTGANYLGITVCNTKAGIPRRTKHVHELVALAFLGPCPEGQEVRHLDGDRRNNAISNLTYGTPRQNAQDRDGHGRTVHGVKSPHAKLDSETVLQMRADHAAGESLHALARSEGVSRTTARRAIDGTNWRRA